MRIDARVPVVFAPVEARPDDYVMIEGEDFSAAPVHEPGCACCLPRSGVGSFLGGLFFARARGSVPFFQRVVVQAGEDGRAALVQAVENDPVASACYRLQTDGRS